MHKSRKWLSLLLCLAMLVSAVPVQVFAIGEESEAEPSATSDVQVYTEATEESGAPTEETVESTETPGAEPSGESEEPDEEPSEEE